MSDSIAFILAANAGLALGAIFFGGLWWTTGKAVTSRHVTLWILGSLTLRMSIALAGFYLVAGAHWERFLGCLLGFIVARIVIVALTARLRSQYGFVSAKLIRTGTSPTRHRSVNACDHTIDGAKP